MVRSSRVSHLITSEESYESDGILRATAALVYREPDIRSYLVNGTIMIGGARAWLSQIGNDVSPRDKTTHPDNAYTPDICGLEMSETGLYRSYGIPDVRL